MKLNVSFTKLFKAVEKMGANPVEIELNLERIEFDPIDVELETSGKEIPLNEIDFDTGLASHKGRQVLLYIKDHSYRDKIKLALKDGSQGNKFHVCDCSTIKDYKKNARKRMDRYIVMNKLTGIFPIAGTNQLTWKYKEGETRLKVCQNCLVHLNYSNFTSNRSAVLNEFNLEKFFSTYSSFFSHLPNSSNEQGVEKYSDDWKQVSSEYRKSQQFICSHCSVNLSTQAHLLHVHHINGVKGDNSASNLTALCADCHRKEPYHGHLFVSRENTVLINQLRKEQGILKNNKWSEVYEYSDPAMYGILKKIEKDGGRRPNVAYEILGDFDEVIAELELAWPKNKECIVINPEDAEVALKRGWAVWSLKQVLDSFPEFTRRVH